MRNKFLTMRNAFSAVFSVLLALCFVLVLCFNSWTAYAADGNADSDEGQDETGGGTVTDEALIWDGDLEKAGWFGNAAAPASYKAEGDTVELHDAAALAYFAHEALNDTFNGKTVILENDIDLANHLWIPIAFGSRVDPQDVMFSGTFDGNGKTIYNLNSREFFNNFDFNAETSGCEVIYAYTGDGETGEKLTIEVPTRDGVENEGEPDEYVSHEYLYGLFGVTGNAVIKDLSVVNVDIFLGEREYTDSENKTHKAIADCIGSIVGYATGNITVTGCTAGSSQNFGIGDDHKYDSIEGVGCAGGLVGRAYSGLYNGEPYGKNNGMVTGNYVNEGYAFGSVYFENCTNYVDVGGYGEGDKKGGMLGYVYCNSSHKFVNCVNYGNINGEDAGGIMTYWQLNEGNGYTESDGTHSVINHDYEFIRCVNYGNINGRNNVGGIFGRGGMTQSALDTRTHKLVISDCINYGNVTNVAETVASAQGATGGIAGRVNVWYDKSGTQCVISDNFNYGCITGLQGLQDGDVAAGGLIGYINFASGAVINGLSGGNCGKVTGDRAGGCIGGKSNEGQYITDYLVNAYKVA